MTNKTGDQNPEMEVHLEDIERTLENESTLLLSKFETYQDDPMFHQLSLKFDLPGYSGLMCTFLKTSNLGDYQLFKQKKKDQEKKGDFQIAEEEFAQNFSDSEQLHVKIKQKPLCPMLETYRGHFKNPSMIFQGTKSILPGEQHWESKGLKTADRVLENLEQSFLGNDNFGQESLVEEFENAPSMLEEDEIPDQIQDFGDYQVENYSEKKKLQDELLNNNLLSQTGSAREYSNFSPMMSQDSTKHLQAEMQSNIFSEEFKYWACLEPEKWKVKAKRIKTSKRSKRKKNKANKQEKSLLDFQLIFGKVDDVLTSKTTIQIMKQLTAKHKKIDTKNFELEDLDPVIPLNPNADLLFLFSQNLTNYKTKNPKDQISEEPNGEGEHSYEDHPEQEPEILDTAQATLNESQHLSNYNMDSQHPIQENTQYQSMEIPNENTLDISKVTFGD